MKQKGLYPLTLTFFVRSEVLRPRSLRRQRLRDYKGFTLIEVLVAIALLAIISLLVWQAMGSSVGSKERFEKKGGAYQAASMAMNLISHDLQMTVLYTTSQFLGVSPSGEQLTKSVFIGTNNGDQDKITFTALSHLRYLKDAKESDLAEISYFLEPSTGDSEFYDLKKRDASPPDAEPEEGGTTMLLLEGVKELNFRYYDPQKVEFGDEWDTTRLDYVNKLPRAVEISLALQDPIDEEGTFHFSTTVLLEMAPGPNDF